VEEAGVGLRINIHHMNGYPGEKWEQFISAKISFPQPLKISQLMKGHGKVLWIQIHLIRIRIQHFCSIRIQAKTELSKTIFFSNFFEIKI
jgi:hypothetical protein